MAEQTTLIQPEEAKAAAKPKQPRQLVRFTFYKLEPQWQLLPVETRQQGKQELLRIYEEYADKTLMRSFSLFGLRSDCDLMLWQCTYAVEDLQGLTSRIRRSTMGPYLRESHAFLCMTKRSIYVGKNARGAHDPRLVITPEDKKYRNYSERGSESGKDRMTRHRLLESSQELHALFPQGRQIAADAAKDGHPTVGAETARDLLLHFDHTQIAFGLILGPSRQLHRLHL